MSHDNALPAEWVQVLDRIDRQIDQALAALVEPPDAEETIRLNPSRDICDRLRQRIELIAARAAQSGYNSQQLETLLTAETEALRTWLTQAAEVGRQLAQGTTRAIR